MASTVDPETGEIADVSPHQILANLARPFHASLIRSRGRYPYIPVRAVLQRLDQATGGEWSWSLHRGEFVDLVMRRREGPRKLRAYVATGTLSIPGLGARDGRGVQELDEGDEDSGGLSTANIILGADSRALRNAAEKFGLWKPGDEPQ